MKVLVTALVTAAVTAGGAYAASANGRLFHAQSADTFMTSKFSCLVGFWTSKMRTEGVRCGPLHQRKVYAIANGKTVAITVDGKARFVCRTDGNCSRK